MLSKVTSDVAMSIFCQAIAHRHHLTTLNWAIQCVKGKMARSADQDQNEVRILRFISEITRKADRVAISDIKVLGEGFPTAAGYVFSVRAAISGLHAPSGSTEVCFTRFWSTSVEDFLSVSANVLSRLGARLVGAFGTFARKDVKYQAWRLDSNASPSEDISIITKKEFFPVTASGLEPYLGTQTLLYDPEGDVSFLYGLSHLEDKTPLPAAELLPYRRLARSSDFFTWPLDMFTMNALQDVLKGESRCRRKCFLIVNLPCEFIGRMSAPYPDIRSATRAALDSMRSLLEQDDIFRSGSHVKELVTQDESKKLAFLYAEALSWLLYSTLKFLPCSVNWIGSNPATLYLCINNDEGRRVADTMSKKFSQRPEELILICVQHICQGWKKVELKDHLSIERHLSEELYDLWLLETPLKASEMSRILTALPLVLGLEGAMIPTSPPHCYLPCCLWVCKTRTEEILSKLELNSGETVGEADNAACEIQAIASIDGKPSACN